MPVLQSWPSSSSFDPLKLVQWCSGNLYWLCLGPLSNISLWHGGFPLQRSQWKSSSLLFVHLGSFMSSGVSWLIGFTSFSGPDQNICLDAVTDAGSELRWKAEFPAQRYFLYHAASFCCDKRSLEPRFSEGFSSLSPENFTLLIFKYI